MQDRDFNGIVITVANDKYLRLLVAQGLDPNAPVILHIDGTFGITRLGLQLIVVGIQTRFNTLYPVAFGIVDGATTGAYGAFLQTIRVLLEEHGVRPDFVMVDFEKAIENAIGIVFPDTEVHKCAFHAVQVSGICAC